MNKLQALNTWMTPKMPLLILGALALGLLFPDQIGLLCPAVSALMMFQTFANSLGSSVQDLGRVLSHPKPVLITMLSLHLLMPLAALGIGSMCFPDQPLYTLSLVLMEGSPAAVSSLMWIVIGGGSVELCLSIILLDTMLSPVILPLTLRLLCGSVVELDTLGMIRDLFVMIVVPAALAMVLCRLLGQSICAKAKQRLSPFSKLALLVIICANVTRCAPFLHELNRELVLLLCITLAMRLIGLGLGFLLSTLFRFPLSGRTDGDRQFQYAEQCRSRHAGRPVFPLGGGVLPLCLSPVLPAHQLSGGAGSAKTAAEDRSSRLITTYLQKSAEFSVLFLFSRQISRHFPLSPALQYRQNRERPPFPNLSGGAAHVGHAGPLASGGADRSQPTPAPKGIRSRTSGGAGGIHPPPRDHPAPVRPPQG